MSVTVTPSEQPDQDQSPTYPWTSLEGDSEGKKIVSWFERVIWHNHCICSHCFARLGTVSELERDDWGHVVEETDYHEAAVQGYDLEAPPESVVGVIPLARERTTCGECGSVGGLAQSDTLSKGEAVDRVDDLVARLRELGHAVDVDEVYGATRSLKSNPERRNDDKRIFAVAAALGIKHG